MKLALLFRVFKIDRTFIGCKCVKEIAGGGADRIEGLSEQMFELSEDLFDPVQLGRVYWQDERLGAGQADDLTHDFACVGCRDCLWRRYRLDKGGPRHLSAKATTVDRSLHEPSALQFDHRAMPREGHCIPALRGKPLEGGRAAASHWGDFVRQRPCFLWSETA